MVLFFLSAHMELITLMGFRVDNNSATLYVYIFYFILDPLILKSILTQYSGQSSANTAFMSIASTSLGGIHCCF